MRFIKQLLIVLFILVFIIACGSREEKGTQSSQKTTTMVQKPKFKRDPITGRKMYMQYCSACHGPDAKGLKGLGRDLVHSEFIKKNSDEQLLQYVIKGRAVDDPLNITGIAMPPKAGNPALKDQEIIYIISYLRTIQR